MSTKHNLKTLSPNEPLFTELRLSIKRAQAKVGMAVNRDLILLYWQIGRAIINYQKEGKWDADLINNIANSLKAEFPEVSGFSKRNLKYMQAFAALYPDFLMVQAGPAQITWEHNCILFDKVKDPDERHWYIQQIVANSWTCDELTEKVEDKFIRTQEKNGFGFAPAKNPGNDLTQQMLLDSHNLQFLTLTPDTQRRYFQDTFRQEVKDFFLTHGRNLGLVGSQYQLMFNNEDYFVDFLFFHIKLRCFVMVNLETEDYCTAQLKKMCELLDVANETLKHDSDNFSIGIILSRTQNIRTAKYILREQHEPHNIVQIDNLEQLPASVRKELPPLAPLLKPQ